LTRVLYNTRVWFVVILNNNIFPNTQAKERLAIIRKAKKRLAIMRKAKERLAIMKKAKEIDNNEKGERGWQ
jgi:hypothetical protein